MRAVVVVIVALCRNQMAGMAQVREQVLVEALVPQAVVEALHEAILHRLARRDVVPFNLAILCHLSMAFDVNSVPLSLTTMQGKPRISAIRSNARATRMPEIDVSTAVARHSRLKSSITQRIRNRRPSARASDTKSSDQRWLGPWGIVIGALVPIARWRPPRLRKVNPSSR